VVPDGFASKAPWRLVVGETVTPEQVVIGGGGGPGAVMVRVRVEVTEVGVPEAVPVTVRAEVPGAAGAPTVRVRVEAAPAVTDVGVNDPVTPVGAPVRDSKTGCADPEATRVSTVMVAVDPWVAVAVDGDALIVKTLAAGGAGLLTGVAATGPVQLAAMRATTATTGPSTTRSGPACCEWVRPSFLSIAK